MSEDAQLTLLGFLTIAWGITATIAVLQLAVRYGRRLLS